MGSEMCIRDRSRDASLRVDNIAVEKKSGNLDKAEFSKMADRLYGLGGDDSSSYSTVFAANYVEIRSNDIVSGLNTVATIDISTNAGANSALSIVDGALENSANNQAKLGALQSSIDFGMERLLQTSIQFDAAKSRAMDADFALQSARLAKEQMLQQMGSFVLSNTQEILRMSLSLIR